MSATIATDAAVIARLRGLGASVDTRAGAEIGTARRNVMANALRSISHLVLYCDFDRWLHWQSTFPDELLELPGQLSRRHPHAWYFSLGRTPRAFESHPRVQRETENQSNLVATIALGTELDVTAGACMMTVTGAKMIVSKSIERSNATDGEWPAIIWRSGVHRVASVQCDGLEFETASFYGKEILEHGGRANWEASTYENTASWARRMALASATASAIARIVETQTDDDHVTGLAKRD